MCGIIGAAATRDICQLLLDGLKRLEYRGYDSAGLCGIDANQRLNCLRTVGRVAQLENKYHQSTIHANTGIAHTRWATHGVPSIRNAHPHLAGNEIAIVHNGIIENHAEISIELASKGYRFASETDSELIAFLVFDKLKQGSDFLTAVKSLREELKGAYAVALIHSKEPERLLAIRSGSPLVIGLAENENFVASDVLALTHLTEQFIYLEDGDIADIKHDSVIIYSTSNAEVKRDIKQIKATQEITDKGDFPHYMLKEIYEQPNSAKATLKDRITTQSVILDTFGPQTLDVFSKIERVQIVACGTSYHAGLVGKQWIEEITGLPTQTEVASEFRYRKKIVEQNTLFVTLSQSGETADTLAALRVAKQSGYHKTLSICNVSESSIARESDISLLMNAGVEIGVASTKSFTSQLISMLLLSIALGKAHHLDPELQTDYVTQLNLLPEFIKKTLKLSPNIQAIAANLIHSTNAIFLARGIEYPIALEGALKMKEITYIHAEAYPAGELKHGPLALIDDKIPIILLAPDDLLLTKLKSNLEEVLSRNGKIILLTNENTHLENKMHTQTILMPVTPALITPILYTIPLQLLAYYVAVMKGTDVDKPRNLAKSVTVE